MTKTRSIRRLAGLCVALALSLAVAAGAAEKARGKAAPAPPAAKGITVAEVRGYLEKMGGACRVVGDAEIRSEARAGGVAYSLLVKVDPARYLVYLAIDDFFPLAEKASARANVTDRMARLNYEMAIGKLEWDAQGGQVRLSHSFSTEDGLGYRTFSGVLATLLASAGPAHKALEEAARGR